MNSIAQKILAGSSERRTRLHTRRGQLVSGRELLRIPRLLRQRVASKFDGPWMAAGAVRRLDEVLSPTSKVLELGSGASTAWYAARVASVVSLEDSADWAAKTREAAAGLNNVEVVCGPLEELGPSRLKTESPTVVIVDHNEVEDFTRLDALRMLPDSVDVAVLDDSDRSGYAQADSIMMSWRRERYAGFRSRPLVPTETTIFFRH